MSAGYTLRLATRSPDVTWNRRTNPEPWQEYETKNYKVWLVFKLWNRFIIDHDNGKTLTFFVAFSGVGFFKIIVWFEDRHWRWLELKVRFVDVWESCIRIGHVAQSTWQDSLRLESLIWIQFCWIQLCFKALRSLNYYNEINLIIWDWFFAFVSASQPNRKEDWHWCTQILIPLLFSESS